MLRLALISALILFQASQANTATVKNYKYIVQEEYRTDSIDYDGVDRTFTREKVKISFSPGSIFNYSHVCVNSTENRITWNFTLSDIIPYTKFLVGNFNVNLGAGLIVRPKIYIPPDDFNTKLIYTLDESFRPETSGNPLYSFNGLALRTGCDFSGLKIFAFSFYSMRRRFIRDDPAMSGETVSTINSINSDIFQSYSNNYPVDINDFGLLLGAGYRGFSSQFFMLYSDIKSGDEFIIWDYSENRNPPGGTKHYLGYGTMLKYSDEYITIFTELSMTSRGISDKGTDKAWLNGFGVLYGLIFRHQRFSMKVTGKHTGGSFYSPYGNSSGGPGSEWHVRAAYRINKTLSAGASASVNRHDYVLSFNPVPYCYERKELFLRFNYLTRFRISVSANFVSRDREFGKDEKFQIRSAISSSLSDFIQPRMNILYQKSDQQDSHGYGLGVNFKFFKLISLNIGYTVFSVAGSNYIYAVNDPIGYSVSRVDLIQGSSSLLSVKFTLKFRGGYLAFRYAHRFNASVNIDANDRIEVIGRINL